MCFLIVKGEKMSKEKIEIKYVEIGKLKSNEKNPRKWSDKQLADLMESMKKFDVVDPAIVNMAKEREYVLIGGHMRVEVAKKLGIKEMPCVFVNIPDIGKERELVIRLNKNQGEFDLDLLSEFDESVLADIGFDSEELDSIFDIESEPEQFDVNKELEKLEISKVEIETGDIYILGNNRLLCGDSTKEEDVLKLMNKEKADMCFTDQPYLLNYLAGKRHGKPTDGFGAKKNRKYIGTDELPPNFIELWTANVAKVQNDNFSIIAFENWKNVRERSGKRN